jgi:hypothetical protein
MLIGKLLAVVPRENETGDTKPQQSGGMKLHLQTTDVCVDRSGLECHYRLLTHTHTHTSNHCQAYWKPCTDEQTGNKENYMGELVAFHIDRYVGFHRTAAVVPRHFTYEQLQKLAADLQVSHNGL